MLVRKRSEAMHPSLSLTKRLLAIRRSKRLRRSGAGSFYRRWSGGAQAEPTKLSFARFMRLPNFVGEARRSWRGEEATQRVQDFLPGAAQPSAAPHL